MNYFKKYNIFQLFFLAIQIVMNKILIAKNVRLVKFPYSIINHKNIYFGDAFTAGKNLRLECINATNDVILTFGKNIKVNDYVHIACAQKITIGDNVLIGSNVLITDHQHGTYQGTIQDTPYSIPDERSLFTAAVFIGENCWIGDMVSIMPGVTIGSGSIIGANSVVTKDITKNTIAVGNPCRVIKQYNDETKKWEPINSRNSTI